MTSQSTHTPDAPVVIASYGTFRILADFWSQQWMLQQQKLDLPTKNGNAGTSLRWVSLGGFTTRDELVRAYFQNTGIFSQDLCGLPDKPSTDKGEK